jgi:PAS domain S-box-containing protein
VYSKFAAPDELQSLRSRIALLSERENLLSRIDQTTRTLTNPEDVLLTSATILGQYLRVNRCAYADVESDQDTFNLTGNYIDGVSSIVGRYTFTQFSLACLHKMRAGEHFLVEDSETDPQILNDAPAVLESFRATGIRSVVCVPILKDGAFSAGMAVHCITPRKWHPEEVDLLRAVANRCWESIERTRVLRDLQESQDRLRLAQEAGKSGTFDWYLLEDRVYWSPELEKLYGVPTGAFEGSLKHWIKRVHPDDSTRIMAEIEGILRRKQRDYGYDFRVIRNDGSYRWLHGQARFLYSPEGTPLRMIGINVDIHERRLTEETLIRTEKLTAVGRLAASIAHEINNPLESVTNLIYLARHSPHDQAQVYLDQADIELRRVSLIANQTLRFHRQSSSPTSVTPEELFDGVIVIHQGRLTNSNIEVQRCFRETSRILCFENEIRQVLGNLVSNAIDAMPSGGCIFIRSYDATDWTSGRNGVKITVADTGSGMSPNTLNKLFEPFFTTKGSNGTGLGLWVSREIVTRHGGRISVRSRQDPPHIGTLFSLFLPLEATPR